MDFRTNFATQGYAQARNNTAPTGGARENTTNQAADFAKDFANTLQTAEETAKASMVGGADPHALVQALAESQLAVETAVTVRNKVVEAYQEILRMPI